LIVIINIFKATVLIPYPSMSLRIVHEITSASCSLSLWEKGWGEGI
jgi:hypothetical protein